jgi:hypothetical protein
MEIKIPKGRYCGECEFLLDMGISGCFCGLLREKVNTFDKIASCIIEFGEEGGEFEIVKKEVKND